MFGYLQTSIEQYIGHLASQDDASTHLPEASFGFIVESYCAHSNFQCIWQVFQAKIPEWLWSMTEALFAPQLQPLAGHASTTFSKSKPGFGHKGLKHYYYVSELGNTSRVAELFSKSLA